MSSEVIRIRRHPSDDEVLLAYAGPDFASTMGKFVAARWAPDLKAYVLARELMGSFQRFATHYDAQLLDERSAGGPTVRHSAPECANCAQPAAAAVSSSLRNCPACGQPWVPVTFTEKANETATTPCPNCDRAQRGRFPHCSSCGAAMTYAPTVPALARAGEAAQAREHLKAPKSLAETFDEVRNTHTTTTGAPE